MTDDVTSLGPRPRIGLFTRLAYGFGSVAYGIKDNGFRVFLLLFYSQVVKLDAGLVSTAILVAMLIDCVFDPFIGELTDNWRSKWGRRHPFMYASALPASLSFLLLWNPPVHWEPMALFWYLVGVAVLVRTFITFYEIPSSSLTSELTDDYNERSKLLGWRYFFGWWGGLTLMCIMFFVLMKETADGKVGQLNPVAYHHYGYVAAVIMFVSIIASAAGTHKFIPWLRKAEVRTRKFGETVREMAGTLNNRDFKIITMVGLFTAFAQGVSFSLAIFFSTYFWELDKNWTGVLVLDSFISSSLALMAAPYLSKKTGKKRAGTVLLALSVLVGFIPMILRLLGLFPDNGDLIAGTKIPEIVPWLFLDGVVRGTLGITAAILITAMLADVVENSELQTGRRSEGLFFAFTSLVQKAVSGVGVFAAGFIIVLIDFPEGANPADVPEVVTTKLALVYMPVLAVFYGIGLAIMQAYRITRESHEETLKTLASRRLAAEEAQAADIAP
ncbi:MFS transporter [Caulobacter sp. NIBR1757]|uniref:MFS transporter n=1 Tax=Caulobacter sp. NIBR1757 TaxID=3016000 RepID=UPI0022F09A6B|nr:MFS transporter [Caulobacter sp. NIBR1757]WGM38154.1 Putative glycoside/cation symporter YagG [Caulobacter sp. NIBR1757]